MLKCGRLLLKNWMRGVPKESRSLSTQWDKMEKLAEQMTHYDKRLPQRLQLQDSRGPFIKNMLIGKFDKEVLAFPEAQDSNRNSSFFAWLKPIEELMKRVDPKSIDKNARIPEELIEQLNELGVFAAYVKEEYGGLELLESEYLKLLEILAKVPAVAMLVLKINRCVDLIQKYASDEQKLEYLPKIANGSIRPTYCLSEERTENPKQINCKGVLSSDDGYYIMQGKKIFVPFADQADIFLTFAHCSHHLDQHNYDKTLSLIIVDNDSKNIDISEPIDTVGVRALPHFNVTFKETKVPVANLVGEIGLGTTMYTEFLTGRKQDTGAIAIGILKNFIELLTYHMVHTRHFNKQLFEYDSAKEVLGKACLSLYAMEAATYMSTALADLHKDQDCAMENCIVQSYCSVECTERISEGIHLIGTQAYLTHNAYELFFRDAHALTVFENSVIDNETFIALIGLQHVGKLLREDIFKLRNPFQFPMFNFLTHDRFINLRIRDYLHPSLEQCARQLEIILYIIKQTTIYLLTKHGSEITENHMDLRRYYQLVSIGYVYSSILARASRAYCNGLRNADHDLQVASSYGNQFLSKVKSLQNQIYDNQMFNIDKTHKQVSDATLQKSEYFAEHPLTRNV